MSNTANESHWILNHEYTGITEEVYITFNYAMPSRHKYKWKNHDRKILPQDLYTICSTVMCFLFITFSVVISFWEWFIINSWIYQTIIQMRMRNVEQVESLLTLSFCNHNYIYITMHWPERIRNVGFNNDSIFITFPILKRFMLEVTTLCVIRFVKNEAALEFPIYFRSSEI